MCVAHEQRECLPSQALIASRSLRVRRSAFRKDACSTDALKGVAFLESDFDALFGADGSATMDAFNLSVGDAALVLLCSRGCAVCAFTAASK